MRVPISRGWAVSRRQSHLGFGKKVQILMGHKRYALR